MKGLGVCAATWKDLEAEGYQGPGVLARTHGPTRGGGAPRPGSTAASLDKGGRGETTEDKASCMKPAREGMEMVVNITKAYTQISEGKARSGACA